MSKKNGSTPPTESMEKLTERRIILRAMLKSRLEDIETIERLMKQHPRYASNLSAVKRHLEKVAQEDAVDLRQINDDISAKQNSFPF